MTCPECEGEGIVVVDNIEVECPVCEGKGVIRDPKTNTKFFTYKEFSRK